MKTQTIAAIDIGSNSLKMAIAQAAASDSFTIVVQERERVRLGHETLRSHRLSDEAIDLSAAAIAKFKLIAEGRGVNSIIAVATASVREAQNAADFVREIAARTGITVEVLSSIEEARLIGIAAAQNMHLDKGRLLNIDIGGGSTELSLMVDGEPHKLFSMKLGAVGLTERFIFTDPPKKKELDNLRTEILLALDRPLRKIKGQKWQISTGTSGTILNLLKLINHFDSLTGETIQLKRLTALNDSLAKMNLEQRASIPVISPQRAEVIIAGGQILENVMRSLGIDVLKPCSFALREGVIIDHLREIEAESLPPVPDVNDARLRGVFAVGRRFGYEEKHALQTAFLAERIFDQLAAGFKLERHQRTLLSAAAILHDVGYHISHESHHKHTLYLIRHSEMTGFSESERAIIANVARYHRGTTPREKHVEFMALGEGDRQTVMQLGAILRLADALDLGYERRVSDVFVKKSKDRVTLTLSGDSAFDAEIAAIGFRKDMFEAAFGLGLEVAAAVR